MTFAISLALPVVSLVIAAGAATQLFISSQLKQDFKANEKFCHFYLCEDAAVVQYAYEQQLRGDVGSLSMAVQMLQELLSRDVASALRWADLGAACAQVGAIGKARSCYDQALNLGYTSAGILISVGDFHLRYGDWLQGLHCLSRTLAITSERDQSVFSYFSARDVGIEDVMAYGLPPERRPAESYLRYLMGQPIWADAPKVWQWMVAHDLAGQRITIDYTNFLLSRRLFKEAADVWASQLGDPQSGYRTKQYIYNGDFEQELSPAAFNWDVSPRDRVEVVRDSKAYSGKFSLCIRFGGSENIDYGNVVQKAVLPPGKYRFQAYVRTEGVTTDRGVFFRISDSVASSRLSVDTEQVLGTTDWHPVSATFVASNATQLIEVRVSREPSLKFDNKIGGAVWIDQVSLTPAK